MKKLTICLAVLALFIAGSGVALAEEATTTTLVTTLVSKLGVTEKQATGGAGAILSVAKSSLSTEDYGKVTAAVPETETLVEAAPKTQSLAGSLGGTVGQVAGVAGLKDSFKSLGLKGNMVDKFVPVVVDYARAKGGDTVGNLLSGVLTAKK